MTNLFNDSLDLIPTTQTYNMSFGGYIPIYLVYRALMSYFVQYTLFTLYCNFHLLNCPVL